MAGPLPDSNKQQKTGYSCEFVKQPPENVQTECPVCLGILRDPYQANCCGKCFCSTCYKKSSKSMKKACPTCKDPDFPAFEDKSKKQALSQFEVYCTHHKSGCHWTGELGDLDRHLNEDPKPGAEKEGCGFVKVGCPHCQEKFERQTLNTHPFDECPRRHVHCTNSEKGCHWEGELADLALHLRTTCKANMVACPNKCGENNIHYQDIESHMEIHCPVKVVDCEFKPVGCQVQLPRRDMPDHLHQSSHQHTLMLMKKAFKVEAEASEEGRDCRTQVADSLLESVTGDITHLKETIESVQRESKDELHRIEQTMKQKVSTKWLLGFTLCAVTVVFVLLGLALLTHEHNVLERQTVGKYSINITDIHTELNEVKKQFLSQFSDLHKELSECKAKFADIIPNYTKHPTDTHTEMWSEEQVKQVKQVEEMKELQTKVNHLQEVMENGIDAERRRIDDIIEQLNTTKLNNEQTKTKTETQTTTFVVVVTVVLVLLIVVVFNHRNKLVRQLSVLIVLVVLIVVVFNHRNKLDKQLQKTEATLDNIAQNVSLIIQSNEYTKQGFSVHDFTLTEFKKCQAKGGHGNWYSEPFYSHPGGYKFKLNVETNGDGDDHGVYMRVWFKLMKGDHDDELDWPVYTTAYVQLLNQLGDHTHHEKSSKFKWSKSQQGEHHGVILQFFKLSELGLNAEKNTQYLKNDCLKFRVYFKAYKK